MSCPETEKTGDLKALPAKPVVMRLARLSKNVMHRLTVFWKKSIEQAPHQVFCASAGGLDVPPRTPDPAGRAVDFCLAWFKETKA